jgi:RimJ/RimL family protein N-acetyltransferase
MVSALVKLLELIVLSCMQGNVGSTNVLNKLGFKEKG